MKTIEELVEYQKENFVVLDTISLAGWTPAKLIIAWDEFKNQLSSVRKETFNNNERIVFIFDTNDYDKLSFEIFFKKFIKILNKVDVSNFFAVILVNGEVGTVEQYFKKYSSDPVLPKIEYYSGASSALLDNRDTFCVAPWIHLMVTPYHEIKTCCLGTDTLGYLNEITLKDAWTSDSLKEIRTTLLNNSYHTNCEKCYEQERNGNRSTRISLNHRFKDKIPQIKQNKQVDDFKLLYLDMRFTNLCNIRCRTCNHHSSSKWYQDEIKLDPSYNKPVIMKSGKTDTDMWEQIQPHLGHVERIYFAGGEPLVMEEQYRILEELEKLQRFDVELFYNTNFTQTKLKTRAVFEYWKKFKSVTVGASLDAQGPRAEYIRKDRNWDEIENNRRRMMAECPSTSFSVQPTASILNIWHLPDFHRDWVEKGLIDPNNFSLNWLQEPSYYRVDIATKAYKEIVKEKIQSHCQWLSNYTGTESVIARYQALVNFMFEEDRSHLIPKFWEKTNQLDAIRNEKLLDVIPELKALL
jgi:MoaA/NifB/PqqE/SkfB family radical SAM enzyme